MSDYCIKCGRQMSSITSAVCKTCLVVANPLPPNPVAGCEVIWDHSSVRDMVYISAKRNFDNKELRLLCDKELADYLKACLEMWNE
jgi:NMD protein affecting ribosome stability and mRNA decay